MPHKNNNIIIFNAFIFDSNTFYLKILNHIFFIVACSISALPSSFDRFTFIIIFFDKKKFCTFTIQTSLRLSSFVTILVALLYSQFLLLHKFRVLYQCSLTFVLLLSFDSRWRLHSACTGKIRFNFNIWTSTNSFLSTRSLSSEKVLASLLQRGKWPRVCNIINCFSMKLVYELYFSSLKDFAIAEIHL